MRYLVQSALGKLFWSQTFAFFPSPNGFSLAREGEAGQGYEEQWHGRVHLSQAHASPAQSPWAPGRAGIRSSTTGLFRHLRGTLGARLQLWPGAHTPHPKVHNRHFCNHCSSCLPPCHGCLARPCAFQPSSKAGEATEVEHWSPLQIYHTSRSRGRRKIHLHIRLIQQGTINQMGILVEIKKVMLLGVEG